MRFKTLRRVVALGATLALCATAMQPVAQAQSTPQRIFPSARNSHLAPGNQHVLIVEEKQPDFARSYGSRVLSLPIAGGAPTVLLASSGVIPPGANEYESVYVEFSTATAKTKFFLRKETPSFRSELFVSTVNGPAISIVIDSEPSSVDDIVNPQLSPDENWVIYQQNGRIWSRPADASAPARQVIPAAVNYQSEGARITPDSQSVLLTDGGGKLYLAPIAGGVPEVLAEFSFGEFIRGVRFSTDNSFIIYGRLVQDGSKRSDIRRYTFATKETCVIAESQGAQLLQTLDKQQLLIAPYDTQYGKVALVEPVCNAPPKKLTDLNDFPSQLTVDGKYALLFPNMPAPEGGFFIRQLWSVALDGSGEQRLSAPEHSVNRPVAISPDSTIVAYTDEGSDIYSAHINGSGDRVQIYDAEFNTRPYILTIQITTSNYVLFSAMNPAVYMGSDIIATPLRKKQPVSLLGSLTKSRGYMSDMPPLDFLVAPDGKTVFFEANATNTDYPFDLYKTVLPEQTAPMQKTYLPVIRR